MTTATAIDPALVKSTLAEQGWRLDHLYCITDKDGKKIPFKMNGAQQQFLAEIHTNNLILKARQLGFSTFINLLQLDTALFVPNTACGVIAHTDDAAMELFRRNIKFPYDHLPDAIKALNPPTSDSAHQIRFKNGSSIRVATSMRSGTLQILHVCLSGDTEIICKDGVVKEIKDIQEGDFVMNNKGSYQRVKMLVKNRIKDVGHPLYAIKTFGHYNPLKLTGNHSILTREYATGLPVWKQANEVVVGDYLAFPVREISMKLRDGCLPFGDASYAYDDHNKRIKNSGKRIAVDENLGFLIGFYLAEGSVRRTETTFSIHRNEVDMLLSRLDRYTDFYHSVRVYHAANSLTATVTVNGKDFAEFIDRFFGSGPDKRIPDAVWGYGRKFMDGMVFGYFSGDGSFRNSNEIQVTSIRRQLIDQLRMILLSLRFGVSSIYRRPAGTYYGRECQEVWVLKLFGAANWKFRKHFNLELPDVDTKAGRWRIANGRNPCGRKLWRRGADHYWSRILSVDLIPDEEFVYDIALENAPHNYVTVNGVVHNSEFGKICNQFPHRAREIVTGSLETVGKGNLVVIESTAEGKEGYFYDYVQEAKQKAELNKKPGITDYRLHFFPWWKEPSYRLSEHQTLSAPLLKQFETIESTMKTTLDTQQRNWYAAKAAKLGDDVFREYPGTIDESFYLSTRGAYFITELSAARKAGRIGKVPHYPNVSVDTWWDLGMDDCTAIWFTQDIGREIHCIDYYEMDGEGLAHYRDLLDRLKIERGYRYGTHNGPHDLAVRELGSGTSRADTAKAMGLRFEVVARVEHKADAIQAARNLIGHIWIDEEKCSRGLKCLESYKKEWDESLGTYRDKPFHDWASHGSDAFMTLARGHKFAVARQTAQSHIPSAAGWT